MVIQIFGKTDDRTIIATLDDDSPYTETGLMDYEVIASISAILAGAEPPTTGPRYDKENPDFASMQLTVSAA